MLQDLVRGVFPRSGCFVFGDGCCVVYLHGDAIGKALKLSGGSVGGFKIVVHEVLPIKKVGGGGVSNARTLPSSFFSFFFEKTKCKTVHSFVSLFVCFRWVGYG